MMASAEIKFDELNTPYIEFEHNEMIDYLYDRQLDAFLSKIDKIQYISIRVRKNSLVLVNKDIEVIISDISKFSNYGLFKKIPSICEKAKKTISKYNRQNAKNKIRQYIKLGKNKVIGTGIVMGMLFVTPVVANNFDWENDIISEQEEDILDDNVDSNIITTKINNNINYIIEDIKEDIEVKTYAKEVNELDQTPAINKDGNCVFLNYELSTDTIKKEHAYDNCYPIVETYAPKWGMSNNIPMSMLTQETGGYETNLMQIEFDVWKEKEIKVYNFKDERYEYFVLTNNPEKYAEQNVTCITEKDLENPVTNISIACVLLRKSAEYMDYHVLAAIQCYNLGKGNMEAVLAKTEEETGQTREEILSDQENISFYQYTNIVKEGDPEYLSHVFAFLSDYGEEITFKHFDDNHNIVEEKISIFSSQQTNTYH